MFFEKWFFAPIFYNEHLITVITMKLAEHASVVIDGNVTI